jgi:hypothetical protein
VTELASAGARGAMLGTLAMLGTPEKKQGLTITSDKTEDGQRLWRIAA